MEGNARGAVLAMGLLLGALAVPVLREPVATAAPSGRSHACIFDHQTLRTAPGKCRPRARAYPEAVSTGIQKAIYDSSLTFSVPYDVLLQLAQCESGLQSHASSHGHYGLYQFAPATFRDGASRMKKETGIAAKSYWNALDAAYVAAYLFVVRQSNLWSCALAPAG